VDSAAVLRVADVDAQQVRSLLSQFGLHLVAVDSSQQIPGSYWGESEAGLIHHQLYCREDTPLQSVLHEASHYICMNSFRRSALHTDAGGDYDEENAVCYLQILLADLIEGLGRDRMLADMDAWGYTFRLGSARAWFEEESLEAKQWLVQRGVIDMVGQLTWMKVE
jgi:hypothetical protein